MEDYFESDDLYDLLANVEAGTPVFLEYYGDEREPKCAPVKSIRIVLRADGTKSVCLSVD
jgi:hypothetical protein